MLRRAVIAAITLLGAIPSFAHTTELPTRQFPVNQAQQTQPTLRLMNDKEFSSFLERLDSDLLRSQQQLKKLDLKSLTRDAEERQELETSYNRCLQSLDSTRDEIQKLAQKQTLKLDLFLLIDLNQLARNLDALDEVLVNPMGVSETRAVQKSLGYARQVLNIDSSLTTEISAFQHHFIAFTAVVDASLEQADADASQAQPQK